MTVGVLASMRVPATTSPFELLTASRWSLPSQPMVYSECPTVPSADTEPDVDVMPAPATTMVNVALLGAVPGATVDFARLSFQVPRLELPG